MANQSSKKLSSSLESAIWFNSGSSSRGKSKHTSSDRSKQTDEDSIGYKSRTNAAKRSGNWEMHIDWDLEHELDLHNLLKHWAQNGVSAKQIGESLVNTLYKRDGHLGYRVTKMVDRCESYGTIGNDMLEHYSIRDVRGKPLWDDHCGDSGMSSDVQVSHRSVDSHNVYSSSGSSYSGSSHSGSAGGSPSSGSSCGGSSRIKGPHKFLRY